LIGQSALLLGHRGEDGNKRAANRQECFHGNPFSSAISLDVMRL
jgi:hypothetical protein